MKTSGDIHGAPSGGAPRGERGAGGGGGSVWILPAMMRPARTVTVVATSARRRTCSPTFTILSPRPGTMMPWNSFGSLGPWSVANDMSTTASSGNGLNRLIDRLASRSVEPVAKYQCGEELDAHGVASQPLGPLTNSSTTAPPPSRSTRAAAFGADARSCSHALLTARGPTDVSTRLASPSDGTTVMLPRS